ncbi:flagellar motor switch protein FliN [Candidatus Poribacteria bacterium]|nr:flagellar motor switch protein FliN [Candidatus Poribacteria bacterium]
MAENNAGSLTENGDSDAGSANIEMVLDIPLSVQVQLGEVRMSLRDVLKLGSGSMIRLNKSDGDAVDLYVNGKLVANGQIVTTPEGTVGVQVTQIATRMERIRSLR